MNKTSRFRLVVLIILVACLSALGMAAYKAYSAFYNHVLEKSEAWHLKVEEVRGNSPLELKITIDANQAWAVIRRISVNSNDGEMTLLYHIGLSGNAPPAVNWGKPYTLIVPESVTEVRFGPRSETIWRRTNSAK
jgi:hypothetical protein